MTVVPTRLGPWTCALAATSIGMLACAKILTLTDVAYGEDGGPVDSGDASPRDAGDASILLGGMVLEDTPDFIQDGTAQAFRYQAKRSGTVTTLGVFAGSGTTSGQVWMGLYDDALPPAPKGRLTQATIDAPVPDAWNTATVPGVHVDQGAYYWIAVLTPVAQGKLYIRDRSKASNGELSLTDRDTDASLLPLGWTQKGTFYDGPASLYAAE